MLRVRAAVVGDGSAVALSESVVNTTMAIAASV
jgi:hypothetical protein